MASKPSNTSGDLVDRSARGSVRVFKSAGIPVNERNIWENPEDAAIVRSIADGNETVPAVIVGPIGLVNPSVKQVQAALEEHAPHLL